MKFLLKECLKSRGISQKEMADSLNLSTSLINQYVQHKCYPNYDILCKMADYLMVTTDELLGRETYMLNLASIKPIKARLIESILKMNELQEMRTSAYVSGLMGE